MSHHRRAAAPRSARSACRVSRIGRAPQHVPTRRETRSPHRKRRGAASECLRSMESLAGLHPQRPPPSQSQLRALPARNSRAFRPPASSPRPPKPPARRSGGLQLATRPLLYAPTPDSQATPRRYRKPTGRCQLPARARARARARAESGGATGASGDRRLSSRCRLSSADGRLIPA